MVDSYVYSLIVDKLPMQGKPNITYAVHSASLDRVLFGVESIAVLRPGQQTPSLLVLLYEQRAKENGWGALKSQFASAQGNTEDALEYAVRRANEELASPGAQDYGACIAVAVDQRSFAAASGGGASACLFVEGKAAIDITPTRTRATRDKLLAALTAGAHAYGTIVLGLKTTADEIASSLYTHAEESDGGMKRGDVAVIAPVSTVGFAQKVKYVSAHLGRLAHALAQRATYHRAREVLRQWARDPKKAACDASILTLSLSRRLCARFKSLSQGRRAFVAAAVVGCALLLHVLLSALGSRNVEEIIAETLKRESKIAELAAQNKEVQALGLLDDALLLLVKAPTRLNDTQRETIESLTNRLIKTAAAINKVSIIASPTPVVSLERSFREARAFDLSGLALAQGKLYTVNRAEKEVYELDGRERRIVVLKSFPAGAGSPAGIVSAVPGLVMVLTDNPRGVLTLDTATREFSFDRLSLPRADALPVALAAYNQKLYLLDARTRAIYRYELTPQGYNLWSPWTDEASLDFSQATTFAIDGSIYVTFSDHDIVKLMQGKRAPFAVEGIRPPLERVTAIATKEESPFIYLLDPPQRRVVVIMKETGALVAQYTSPVFDDLRGLFPDEAAKRIYLLNGDTVYSVGPEDESITDLIESPERNF